MKERREGLTRRLVAVVWLLTALLPAAAEAQDGVNLNRVKELLLAGKPAIGAICDLPSAPATAILSQVGFDWLWLDMEHGAASIETVQLMVQATKGTPTVPLVRIPWNHHWLAKPVLDTGAMGVITPFVNTKEDAAAAVAALRYPPEGVRGFLPTFAALRWGLSVPEYLKVANKEILSIMLIEHHEAVEHIEEILSVPGVDVVFVGMFDLSGSMGLLGQTGHPRVEEAAQKVLAAAKKAKVAPGIISLTPDEINKRIEQGFQFIAVSIDTALLQSAAKGLVDQIKR